MLSLCLGACGTLSFSPFDIWPTAIISIIGLNYLIINKSNTEGFFIALWWGIGLFGFGINWIYISIIYYTNISYSLGVIIITVLIIYLSLYPGIFAYIINTYYKKCNIYRLLFASPVIWHITEYLRGIILTGFPWLQFGYTQIDGPLKNIAPLFGVEMITITMVIISNSLILSIKEKKVIYVIFGIIILIIPKIIMNYKWITPLNDKKIHLVLVQGNIDQNIKWQKNYLFNNINTYIKLSKPYFNLNKIIVWPESAIVINEADISSWLKYFDKMLKIHNTVLITGIITTNNIKNENINFFNSIISLGNEIAYNYQTNNRYYKHHLVPFGEYIPFHVILKSIFKNINIPMSNFINGKYKQKQLIAGKFKLTPSICYESILGNQIKDNFKPNTDFILTITNDAWFRDSHGPWQHLQMTRMRALELGRPLVQASNNGITAIIKPNGDIQNKIPQFKRTVLIDELIPTTGITPFSYYGNLPTSIFLSILFLFSMKNIISIKNKKIISKNKNITFLKF
uniref:Apolipoprotein N-acyltransferase n=1 Tax=Candidatus Aschnera chinzeii TaxID=1485666 RepID=A0AAT9G3U0_9ENTR|nr:MAG: apolipoprotein N-acyltransferase [Candidatus Aschnera chinzeii]